MKKKKKTPVKPKRLRRVREEARRKPQPARPVDEFQSGAFGEGLGVPVQDIAGGLSGQDEQNIPRVMPVLPVRDIVVFNYMILPLFVGREKSIKAVDAALSAGRHILILTQKDEAVEEPGPEDVYRTGTVAMVMRMLKMPDGRLKILVQGLARARVARFTSEDSFHEAEVELVHEGKAPEPSAEEEALMRTAREHSEKILSLRGISPQDIMAVLNNVHEPGRLADLIASNLRIGVAEAQQILEAHDPMERLRMASKQLGKEVEVANMQNKIQTMAKEGMDRAQRDFYLREQLKAIKRELGDQEGEGEEMEGLAKAIERAGMPKEVRKEAFKQLKRLETMHAESSEATVIRTYLDWMIELPWKKMSRDRLDIKEAARILDEDHYDLTKVKERILEYLSVRKLNPKMKGPILCFVGPPGVGQDLAGPFHCAGPGPQIPPHVPGRHA